MKATIGHSLALAFALSCSATAGNGRGGGGCGGPPAWAGGSRHRSGATGEACSSNRCDWSNVNRGRWRGLSSSRVEEMLTQCRKSGLSAEEAERMLAPVRAADEEGLPVEWVYEKVREGLAKRVDADRIVSVAEARTERLRSARRILRETGGVTPRLIARAALLMESGLSEADLGEWIGRCGGGRPGRMIHVMDVGESVLLAGGDSSEAVRVMERCLAADLSGMQMRRLSERISSLRGEGRDSAAVRAEIESRIEKRRPACDEARGCGVRPTNAADAVERNPQPEGMKR